MASPVPDRNKPRPEKGQILLVIRKFPLWQLCIAPDILSERRMRCGKMRQAAAARRLCGDPRFALSLRWRVFVEILANHMFTQTTSSRAAPMN